MASHYFTVPQTGVQRHVQPSSHRPVKVILSKEARARLGDSCRKKSERFQAALNDAWRKVDELTQTLASNHQKSVRCVHNELHIGFARHLSQRKKANPWNAFCWKQGNQSSRTVPHRAPSVRVRDADKENGMSTAYV
jgi:hypothetical protein